MLDENGLTICTISFGHAQHLALNWNLTAQLNHDFIERVEWMVAENSPQGTRHRILGTESQFIHFAGAPNSSLGASNQHATALNDVLQHTRTRFVLILDPDFYILRPNWVADVIRHMREAELSFFGAPWHPRYVENYRYFPAVHCMFVDSARVPVKELDFRPILTDRDNPRGIAARGMLHRLTSSLRLDQRRRRSWDTGTRVYQRFAGNSAVRVECVAPVYRIRQDWLGSGNPLRLRSRFIETFLPDEMCYIPKRRHSYTTRDFSDRGWAMPELPNLWEQHVWREAPFGLHMRGSYSGTSRDAMLELQLCQRALEAAGRPANGPSSDSTT